MIVEVTKNFILLCNRPKKKLSTKRTSVEDLGASLAEMTCTQPGLRTYKRRQDRKDTSWSMKKARRVYRA